MAIDQQTYTHPKAQNILDAAERLFMRHGYRKSSMDDVARDAGIAKGTVYQCYAGKEALFRALLERIGGTVIAASQLAAGAEHAFSERLYGVLNAYYGYFYERFSASGHLQELGEVRGSLGQDLSEQLLQRHQQILVDMLLKAEEAGDIRMLARGLSAHDVALTLVAAANGARLMLPPDAGIKAYIDALRRTTQVFSLALATDQ